MSSNPHGGQDLVQKSPADPVSATRADLVVAVEPEGLLVSGDREAVARYLERVKSVGGAAVSVAGLDGKALADTAAMAASVAGIAAANAGGLVRLSPGSLELLKAGNLVKGTDGFNRMFVTGSDHLIKGQLQWQNVVMAPQAALALQMAMVTVSLRTAIASVEAAVERVQESVDKILTLAKASQTGNVVGHHAALTHVTAIFDEHGQLAAADWDAVAGLGPQLEVCVAGLREHISLTLKGFNTDAAIQDRAKYLHKALADDRLGESLQLLVVAEDSVYMWQRLRIERVRATESEILQVVVSSARKILAEHIAQDSDLVRRAQVVLSDYAKAQPLEYFRPFSSSALKKDIKHLRDDVDSFSEARRGQVAEWTEHADPKFAEAVDEIGHRIAAGGKLVQSTVKGLTEKTVDAGMAGIGRFGAGLQHMADGHQAGKEKVAAEECD